MTDSTKQKVPLLTPDQARGLVRFPFDIGTGRAALHAIADGRAKVIDARLGTYDPETEKVVAKNASVPTAENGRAPRATIGRDTLPLTQPCPYCEQAIDVGADRVAVKSAFLTSQPTASVPALEVKGSAQLEYSCLLDSDASALLSNSIGDEEGNEVTLHIGEGHSGYGLYVSWTEYPDEGAVFITPCAGTAPKRSPSQPRPGEPALTYDFVPAMTAHTRDVLTGAVKWIERIVDRSAMLPRSFLDDTDPAPLAKELRELLKVAVTKPDEPVRGVPPGWKLVPVKATPEMSAAGFVVSEAEHDPSGVYAAMLAAAPTPPVGELVNNFDQVWRQCEPFLGADVPKDEVVLLSELKKVLANNSEQDRVKVLEDALDSIRRMVEHSQGNVAVEIERIASQALAGDAS